MGLLAAATSDVSMLFVELGAAIIGLAVLARVAGKLGYSAIPLYLIAGLAFGNGGVADFSSGREFVRVGAEVGVVLLLFMLGVEYTGEKLLEALRTGFGTLVLDFVLNFTPGFVVGLLVNMPPLAAVLLGGVTYISSTGVIARIIHEFKGKENRETPFVVQVLVLEDLAMAVFLPIIAVLLSGAPMRDAAVSVSLALVAVCLIVTIAVVFGRRLSRFVSRQSDEVVLLSVLGLLLLVSGLANLIHVSAPVAAFLVGVGVSGSLAGRARQIMSPLRDLFAATFFLFFGLQVSPSAILPQLPLAFGLAALTALTKFGLAFLANRREPLTTKERLRAGATLMARGEFSIVISGLGAAIEPRLGPLAAGYVLLLAVLSPTVVRLWAHREKPVPAALT